MRTLHEFTTPRNLYEKLIRESEKLEREVSGDNVFNFISTACHLKEWIRKSPLFTSEQVKRYLKRLTNDESIQNCSGILNADSEFKILENENDGTITIKIGNDEYSPEELKTRILETYEVFFKIKGHDH